MPLPVPQHVPITDGSGNVTMDWLKYFQSRERIGLSNLPDVSTTAPTNGQVLIWNSATKLWVPGAN